MEKPVKASPTSNGSVTAAPALSPIQIGIETTFIKSSRFSRELAVDKTLTLEDKPVIRCEFRISHQALNQKDQYAITLSFGVTAEQESQTLYHAEVAQVGIFKIQCDAPSQQPPQWKEQIIHGYCATLLYPFIRQKLVELTVNANCPPLQMPIINFEMEYQKRLQQTAATTV